MTLLFSGIVIYANRTYLNQPEGIKNNGVWHRDFTNKGSWAWMIGIILTAFYVVLYWFPQYLGLAEAGRKSTGIVGFFDPLSYILNGKPASQWFVYGTLYTIAILGLGYKFILKYRHNKYQLVRTISVMFFQLGFAFLIRSERFGHFWCPCSRFPLQSYCIFLPLRYRIIQKDFHYTRAKRLPKESGLMEKPF